MGLGSFQKTNLKNEDKKRNPFVFHGTCLMSWGYHRTVKEKRVEWAKKVKEYCGKSGRGGESWAYCFGRTRQNRRTLSFLTCFTQSGSVYVRIEAGREVET
jgi:hypothetical protein